MSKKISEETTTLNKFCSELSDTRKKSSIILQELITEHLSQMDMSYTQFLIILEQTESSAIEFHEYLVDNHTPFAQRISGNSFDLAFDLTETLEVVTKRLEKEREELFSVGVEAEIKEKINNNEYFTLTKETLERLYNAEVSHYNSIKLNPLCQIILYFFLFKYR